MSFDDNTTRRLVTTDVGSLTDYWLTEMPGQAKTYGADVQWIHYSLTAHGARTYAGGGVTWGYGRTRVAQTLSAAEGVIRATETIQRDWRAGVLALAGVEWAPTERFGLMLEYLLEGTYSEREVKEHIDYYNPYSPSGIDSRQLAKSWHLSMTSVRLGVGCRL